eukprot:13845577-Alexandrium_andersonii.AAC.1
MWHILGTALLSAPCAYPRTTRHIVMCSCSRGVRMVAMTRSERKRKALGIRPELNRYPQGAIESQRGLDQS